VRKAGIRKNRAELFLIVDFIFSKKSGRLNDVSRNWDAFTYFLILFRKVTYFQLATVAVNYVLMIFSKISATQSAVPLHLARLVVSWDHNPWKKENVCFKRFSFFIVKIRCTADLPQLLLLRRSLTARSGTIWIATGHNRLRVRWSSGLMAPHKLQNLHLDRD